MMKGFFKGVATAMPTPFYKGEIDFPTLEKLISFQIEANIDALVFLGTTGEASTLSEEEQEEIFRFAVACNKGQSKLVFGTGCNDTKKAIQRAKKAESLGADGLLVVTPYYNKCTQEGLISHYQEICAAVDIPVIAYSVPARTGMDIKPHTLKKLCEIPNFAGVKDASRNIFQTMESIRLCRDFCDVFVGDDALSLPLVAMGASGVISVTANLVPWDMKKLYRHACRGEWTAAQNLFYNLLPLIDACFVEINPIPIKTALSLLGYGTGEMRAPLTIATMETQRKLFDTMKKYGLKV